VGLAKTAEGLEEHNTKSETFTQSPNFPDKQLKGSNGICGKQAYTTKTPPNIPQGPKNPLQTSRSQTIQDTLRWSLSTS